MAKKSTTNSPSTGSHVNQTPSAREKLLAAADDLFYAEGIHVVGVDRIIERAGVAKASLYGIFGSKDELVRAYLEKHFRDRQTAIAGVLAAHDTPRDRLLGMFDEIGNALVRSEWRGCRFINGTVEARAGDASEIVSVKYRDWLRSVFVNLVKDAGAREPKELGRQLHLLYDGAAVAARMDEDRRGAATAVRAAVVALFDAAISPKRSRHQTD
jgi:AcrR family transcriptional regulator